MKRSLPVLAALILCAHAAVAEVRSPRTAMLPVPGLQTPSYPSVATLENGDILCVFSANRPGAGKLLMAGVISKDHGQSWSEPRVLIDTPNEDDYDPNINVVGSRVIVTSTTVPKGKNLTTSRTLAIRSDDNGVTWSKPAVIDMKHRYTSGKVNNGIVLRDGSLLLPFTWENKLDTVESIPGEPDMIERSSVMISHDRGDTWTSGGAVIDDALKDPAKEIAISGISEPAIVELSDGAVYMLARTGVDRLYESRSRDGGRSWSKPVPSPLTGHNAPAAFVPFKARKPGILVIWNNSPTDRWPLSVAVTFDDARTFSPPRDIAHLPGLEASYPGGTQAKDGALVVFWQQTRPGNRTRELMYVRFDPEWVTQPSQVAPASTTFAATDQGELSPPSESRTYEREGLKVTVGPHRIIMRGPMFPRLSSFSDGSVILTADAVEEGGKTTSIRSTDRGQTWRPFESALTHAAGFNTVELDGGRALAMAYDTKAIADRPGFFHTTRYESTDLGKTAAAPVTDGTLELPAKDFGPDRPQWFHGNIIRWGDKTLLAAMQGRENGPPPSPFRTFLSRSEDGGKTWKYVSTIATIDMLAEPLKAWSARWRFHGPCEPTILRTASGRLLCVMRLVNDDDKPPIGSPAETYHDLLTTLRGDDVHPALAKLPADRFYTPGELSVPLAITWSQDEGKTWQPPRLMAAQRGCFPRLARSGKTIVLVYGALGFPRWGNCVSVSRDDGETWTAGVNFGPQFTTGYCDVVTIGDNRYLCVHDATPPQPWKNHAAHWVGAVDITVTP